MVKITIFIVVALIFSFVESVPLEEPQGECVIFNKICPLSPLIARNKNLYLVNYVNLII